LLPDILQNTITSLVLDIPHEMRYSGLVARYTAKHYN